MSDHFAGWLGDHGLTPTEIRHQAIIQSAAVAPRAFALFDAWWASVRGPA